MDPALFALGLAALVGGGLIALTGYVLSRPTPEPLEIAPPAEPAPSPYLQLYLVAGDEVIEGTRIATSTDPAGRLVAWVLAAGAVLHSPGVPKQRFDEPLTVHLERVKYFHEIAAPASASEIQSPPADS